MTKPPLATILKFTAGLALVTLLTSCATITDPAFEAVRNSIPDTDYPAAKIVGQWMNVQFHPLYVGRAEFKEYFDLRPNGTGLRRRVMSHLGKIIEEQTADLKWSYLGNNRWSIAAVPGSFQYQRDGKIYASAGRWTDAAQPCVVRLLPPRLYDVTFSRSFVPMDNEGLVRAIHQEQR